MNAGPAQLSQQQETLVAYLDGELDDATRRMVEERLSTDATLRADLSALQSTWEALEKLPRTEVGENFTQTTVAIIAVEAEKEIASSQALQTQKSRRMKGAAAGLAAVAACLGWLVASWFWPNPNTQLLQDLPLLERLDEYRQLDSPEFLYELEREQLFPEEKHGS